MCIRDRVISSDQNIIHAGQSAVGGSAVSGMQVFLHLRVDRGHRHPIARELRQHSVRERRKFVGASLRVSAPLGQYDDSRAVNLGTNRWTFKPELGVSKALGPWTLEGTVAATLFTDNKDFFNGQTRSQDPLYSLEGHAIHSFSGGVWGSLDATYFAGGRTTLDGMQGSDLQQNWRFGATLAFPVDRYHSIKLYGSSGVSARTGNNFDLLGIAWQYRWGGGL